MLRYRKYWVLSLLLTIALAYIFPRAMSVVDANLRQPVQNGEVSLEGAQTSIAYRLDTDTWIDFPVPASSPQIKVVSNATVDQATASVANLEWRYALQFQVVGKDGKVIQDHIYHHRSHITRYINEAGESNRLRSYFLAPEIAIADGRQMLLDLSDRSDVALFRLRLHSKADNIQFVIARAYAPEKIAEHKLAASWQRMSRRKKENLAKGNVYPARFLSASEKRNLLRKQWRPMGPAGVEGTHYFPKMLYSFSGQEKENFREEILPVGLEIDEFHHGVVPIPERGGALRLDFRAVGEVDRSNKDPSIRLSWYGRLADEYWQNTIIWSGESEFTSEGQVDGGQLLIESPIPLVVRAYLRTVQGEVEITPERMLTRLYMGTTELPVEYPIHHSGDEPTPVRIDLRRLFDENQADWMNDSDLDYQLLDRSHRVILTGTFELPDQVSVYDRLRGEFAKFRISEPERNYLLIPKEAASLRLSHSAPTLVSVYNRPYQLTKRTRVPEDSFAASANPKPIPAWFLLRPTNLRELTVEQQTALLTLQSRPPIERATQQFADDAWQSYQPVVNHGSHLLFVPNESSQQTDVPKEQTLASIFCEVPAGRTIPVNLKAHGDLWTVKPQIVYLQDSVRRFGLNVWLDGMKFHRSDRIARHGIAHLPPIDTGHHHLQIKTGSAARFFMNYMANCTGTSYSKRRVHRMGRRGLQFRFVKKTWNKEVLSARIYTKHGSDVRVNLDVDIDQIKRSELDIYPSWTFEKRSFDIRPDNRLAAYILQGTPRKLNAGQSIFIPFGEDQPPGNYTVSFTTHDHLDRYLSLASRQTGIVQQHWIYKDTTTSNRRH